MTKRVAIIGAAHRFPSAPTSQRFWQALKAGEDLVTTVADDRWGMEAYRHPDKQHPGTSYTFAAGSLGDIAGFDASFFGISPREAAQMDPQQRILLEMAWEAMEDAGIPPQTLRGSQCGVFLGIASLDYSYRMADDMSVIDTSTATGNTSSIASNRISYVFDLHGPSMSMDTACSSSLVAFHQACQSIRSGETEMALAGGISLHLHPFGFIIFSKASMLSPTGRCQVFDESGDGYVRSEGGGIFLLKDYDKAVADGDRILAVVAGSGVNTDGFKKGLTVPNTDAQVALMSRTLARAGLTPDDIDYLEAHGTGTAVGDPLETRAIGAAIGQKRKTPLPIGSVKSNLGHLETASGVAGLAKALYALREREVPATIGIRKVNPRIDLAGWNLDIVDKPRKLKAEGQLTIGINSFGFGGANAHVILQSPSETLQPEAAGQPKAPVRKLPLCLSARSPEALREFAARLSDNLTAGNVSFYDTAYSLAFRRERHPHAAVLLSDNAADAITRLDALAAAESVPGAAVGERVDNGFGPVFVYDGNGCQWTAMGRTLLNESPVFAAAVDEVDALFASHAGFSLRAELEGINQQNAAEGEDRLARTEIAQPALFALQVGVTRLLESEGVRPAAVTGHSVGEVAAAWACGALSLADAVSVIYHRSACQGRTRGSGEMTAVGLGADAMQRWLDDPADSKDGSKGYADIVIAGDNSPKGVTLAGPTQALERLEAALSAERVFAKRLALDYAFHSPAMDPIRQDVIDALRHITPRAGRVPFISTVAGKVLEGSELGAEYWWLNIREPVQFGPAVDSLIESGARAFIEIGAQPILRRYLTDAFTARSVTGSAIGTLSRDHDGASAMEASLAALLVSGAVSPEAWFPVAGRFVDLPHYPWQRERYWIKTTGDSQGLMGRHYEHPLLGYRLARQGMAWESQLDTRRLPWLADHRVGDATVFPGAGFAELALAAAAAAKASPVLDIEALEILSPLLLDAAHGKKLQLEIQDADGTLTMKTREPASEDAWTLNARARIAAQTRGLLLTRRGTPLPDRPADVTREQHLAMAAHVGLEYGPGFQAISEIWIEGDRAVGRVELPAAIAEDQRDCLLAPGILDSAFQLFIPLLADELAKAGGLAFVPVRLERLQLQVDAAPPASMEVRLTNRAPHSLCADVALFDAAGNTVAVVEGARFKAARLRHAVQHRLSYLDHRLVPAPREAAALPLDDATAELALGQLIENYRSVTDGRYGDEVEPLLETLVSAFLDEALRSYADSDGQLFADQLLTDPLLAGPLEAGTTEPRQRRQAVIELALAIGIAAETPTGWQLQEAPEIDAATIWNLLIRDYPDYAALTHSIGRFGLHLTDWLEGRLDDHPDSRATLGLDAPRLTRLVQAAVSERGWYALADTWLSQYAMSLELLPPHQRLVMLEASALRPQLGERLMSGLTGDRAQYRFAALRDSASSEAQSLAEHDARVDLLTLDAAAPAIGANVALVTLDGTQNEIDKLLRWLPAQLADDAQIAFLVLGDTDWQSFLSMAMEPDTRPADLQTTLQQLEALGYRQIERHALESEQGGLQLLTVQAPMAARSTETESERLRGDAAHPAEQWLIISDDHSQWLAAKLVTRFETLGQTAHHLVGSELAPQDLLPLALESFNPSQIVDLRGLASAAEDRCVLAAQWLQTLEAHESPSALWWLTLGVGAHYSKLPEDAAKAPFGSMRFDDAVSQLSELSTRSGATALSIPPEAAASAPHGSTSSELSGLAEDAALWGFGRSLQNEAGSRQVRLLDLPLSSRDTLSNELLDALLFELSVPDAETEIVLDADGQRWVPRLGLAPAPGTQVDGEEASASDRAVSLGFELPGQLRHLRWQPHDLPAPQAGQVEIAVKATGLNFRDVMYALGLLSDEAIENGFAGPTLGLEFAGEVISVGDPDGSLRPGDAVVGFGPASFSDRLIADVNAVARIPAEIGYAAAATIPTTFFTVYYSLKHLARVQPGERLLIHGAAGGVGLAAIQVGRWLGAEIYATVGSPEKQDFLRLMGVDRIYDSRSLTFAEEILHDNFLERQTREGDGNGQRVGADGVDVVLNSLAGEAINQNLRVLKPFGRFIELGKRDFYENTKVGLRPFRNNLSYFGVDSDQLMSELPELTGELFTEMMALFADGTLSPLPYIAFGSDRVVEAFRYMQQARQIGKVVVTYERPPQMAPAPAKDIPLTLNAASTYVVTGGLGGFGLATAEWLAAKGARQLLLLSRRGPVTEEAEAGIARLEALGVTVAARACDVTDAEALERVLDEARQSLGPIHGIVHAATVIDDGLIRNLDESRIRHAMAPKLEGARHLDSLTVDDALEFFVVYSSATTLFGNPGQASYVAANHWLEAFTAHRRANGRPATVVRWGAIEDVGFLARNTQTRDSLQERLGGQALTSADALAVLERMLVADVASLGVLELDWRALARFLPTAEAPRYREIARTAEDDGSQEGDDDLQKLLASLAPEALYTTLIDVLSKELAKILLIDEEKIDIHKSVYDMGFDSLMGVELVTALEARLGVQVPVMVLSEAGTLAKLCDYLMLKLRGDEAPSDSDEDALSGLAAQHGVEVLQNGGGSQGDAGEAKS
ncbi:type I polyketide synthase [Salinicola salarius]|uniref:type I polyketide synthase n=1 Tax=Salinicola salarius TaxID=430457 RepID=UPI001FC9C98A|nr:type I polyketide synthase [Salinicola salarius]